MLHNDGPFDIVVDGMNFHYAVTQANKDVGKDSSVELVGIDILLLCFVVIDACCFILKFQSILLTFASLLFVWSRLLPNQKYHDS